MAIVVGVYTTPPWRAFRKYLCSVNRLYLTATCSAGLYTALDKFNAQCVLRAVIVNKADTIMSLSHVALFRQTSNKSLRLQGSARCTAGARRPKNSRHRVRNIITVSVYAALDAFWSLKAFCTSMIYQKVCCENSTLQHVPHGLVFLAFVLRLSAF